MRHYKRDCPKEKCSGKGDQVRVLAIGSKVAIQEPTVVTGTFHINNSYAYILMLMVPKEASLAISSNNYKTRTHKHSKGLQIISRIKV